MRSSGLDPVAYRLRVQLQQLGDLSDGQKLIWHALRLTEYNGRCSERAGQLPRVKLDRVSLTVNSSQMASCWVEGLAVRCDLTFAVNLPMY